MRGTAGHDLLDCGDGRRLERFAGRVIDRPAPAASGRRHADRSAWATADLRFDRERGWTGDVSSWTIEIDGLTLELRPTPSGGVGLFPEHHRLWPYLLGAVADREAPAVLHLFASTGATTLALASAGAAVTHVDASRPVVAWARRNGELSGLAPAPIRWIVDDALAFTRREARRGRRYDGIVLDPPSYGHGPGGQRWAVRDALPELLDGVLEVAADDAFVVVTAHTTGLSAGELGETLFDAAHGRGRVAVDDLVLQATSGAVLPAGVAARMILR